MIDRLEIVCYEDCYKEEESFLGRVSVPSGKCAERSRCAVDVV